MRLRLPRILGATTLVAALATLVVVLVPAAGPAYREPDLHILIETVAGVVALLAALLLFGRFRTTGRLDALMLAAALLLLGATNLFLGALAPAIADDPLGGPAGWGALLGRLAGDLTLVAAAFVPLRSIRRRRRGAVIALGAAGGAFAAAVAVGALLAPAFPVVVTFEQGFGLDRLEAHPLLEAVQLGTMLAYAAASVSFARRARLLDDGLLAVLAGATLLGAFARLNYALEPSLYTAWVYSGDLFRLAAYLVLLAGAFLEITRYWQAQAQAAALQERRRFARDVHDGVAQELAYIVREGRRAALPAELLAAAERGLDESRRAIAALRRPVDEPLDVAIVHATSDVAGRSGAQIEFALEREVQVSPHVRDVLARIAREAVANATKHGQARRIRVVLDQGDGVRLRIRDDGCGFDPAADGGGFGLVTMRERAGNLGARLDVRSAPGRGTEVEVTL